MKINNKRKESRDKCAEALCQEVRYQIANNFRDEPRLYRLLIKWMKVSGKSKYERPK